MALDKLIVEFLPNFNERTPLLVIREENGEVFTQYREIADYYCGLEGSHSYKELKKWPLHNFTLSLLINQEFSCKSFKDRPASGEIQDQIQLAPFAIQLLEGGASIGCHPLDFLQGGVKGFYSRKNIHRFFSAINDLHRKRDTFITKFNLQHTCHEMHSILKEGVRIMFNEKAEIEHDGIYERSDTFPKHCITIADLKPLDLRKIILLHELVHVQLDRNGWKKKKYIENRAYRSFVEYCVEYQTTRLFHEQPQMLQSFRDVLNSYETGRAYVFRQ